MTSITKSFLPFDVIGVIVALAVQQSIVFNIDCSERLKRLVHPLKAPNYETYLHRIGRSGRFGKKGAAFNLLLGPDERAVMDKIAEHFDHPVPEVEFNDDDAFEHVLEEAGLMSKEE